MLNTNLRTQRWRKHWAAGRSALWCVTCFLLWTISAYGQQTKPAVPVSPPTQQDDDAVLPGDWAPELLDGILSSPNADARDALMDATFAAGPTIIPQLEAALKDDRTAEFAAQSLAYIGTNRALEILSKLVADPRDLDLRRFFYGALGEIRTPQATQILLDAIARSDAEPDRTVTEAAIIALTVRSEETLAPSLKDVQSKVKDVVIHDDLENAAEVIGARAKYLSTPEGNKAGDSVQQAVRSYFAPALEPPPESTEKARLVVKDPKTGKTTASPPTPARPPVSVDIQTLTFSPDRNRALAHVVFQDPSAVANYDMVLQKRYGAWTIASVWLGAEKEKPPVIPNPKPSAKDDE